MSPLIFFLKKTGDWNNVTENIRHIFSLCELNNLRLRALCIKMHYFHTKELIIIIIIITIQNLFGAQIQAKLESEALV